MGRTTRPGSLAIQKSYGAEGRWFADARDRISIFTHIVQSALITYLYKVFERRAPHVAA